MFDDNIIINTQRIKMTKSSRIILNDIALQITKGLTIITGSNGAGKSTLLKILGNLSRPTSGKVFYSDNIYINYSSFMFQEPIFLNRSVNDNLQHALKFYNNSNINYENQINEYLDMFNVHYLKYSFPKNISTGEKKIISYIRSILVNPSMIFLDEPCANLDVNYQKLISSYINNLSEKIPTVVVSHYDELNLYNASKIYKLENSRVV